MKKYHIENNGCDDTTTFDIKLTDKELNTLIKVFEANNKVASYGCMPSIFIYEYVKNKNYYDYDKRLNRDYDELND